jgi:8-oxo-dGTP pyrophosphatase MutT (NUDIX family)
MADDRPSAGPRALYTHRVTFADVGERVTVRHVIDPPTDTTDADRQPQFTDVVGRLVVADDEVLMIVDRQRQLHVVAQAGVVASKVIPPHPRLAAEPLVGTRDTPLERLAARVLLLDDQRRTLLVGHVPADDRVVWTAPGGGLKPGEGHLDAAARELREELAITPAIGPWIWHRRVTFSFRGLWIDQDERWFLAHTAAFDPATAPLADHGATDARWWRVDELRASDIEVAPADLADHLDTLTRDGPPPEPIDVGR